MAAGMKQVWVFRIVHQDTGKPAQGVPVTVLEPSGNAAGYWVSEADGTVAIPRRDRKSTRLNSSHSQISYAVFCLKKNSRRSRPPSSASAGRRRAASPERKGRTR